MNRQKIDWLMVAHYCLLSRELDRLEVEELAPQGIVKYQFSAMGHELAQVLLAQAMDHPHDGVSVYYRSRPFMLASGLSTAEALAAGMARTGSPSEGRDIGVVFNLPSRSGPTVLPSSGNVGSQYTPAAGWAQAIRYRQNILGETDWQGSISVVLGGDASVASNGFWSALIIATTQNLPLLFMIEDNSFGISVPSTFQVPDGDISANLASFGNLKILRGDGTQPIETWEMIRQGIDHVRSGGGPCLMHVSVVRLTGHTFIDDQSYKSPELREAEAMRDPLINLRATLLEQGISQVEWDKLISEAQEEVNKALIYAKKQPNPDPSEAERHLFFEGISPKQGGLRPEGVLPEKGSPTPKSSGPRINFVDAVRRTLNIEMEQNPRIMVFGEDVGLKGGVHGATMDMQSQFGSQRVFDTSLSEEGIIGRSVGLAVAGLLPVPEIQFRKYADPAQEQLTDLGSIRWRTANKFAAPVVVRIPGGYGKKVGDPWHSVSAEAVFAHSLGWRIAYPSNAEDAVGLLRTALRGDDPTFFFEHRALLDTVEGRRPYPGDDYCLPFGKAAWLENGGEMSIITWGAMVSRCLEAASKFSGRVTVLDLRTIIPWDQEAVLEAVHRTGKALIVHEDTRTAGFAGEIIATIAEQAFSDLDAPIERLTTADMPIPYNIDMMNQALPSVKEIRKRIEELLAY